MRKQKSRNRKEFIVVSAAVAVVLIVSASLSAQEKKSGGTAASGNSAPAVHEKASCTYVNLNDIYKPKVQRTPITIPAAEPAYKSCGTFTITAYCPCVECCGEWSAEHYSKIGTDYIQKTASGTIPTAGRTIGVDPSVIPFGTTVIINGNEYIAEDSGSAVNGNTIDVFFDTHSEALEFGCQTAEVYIKN